MGPTREAARALLLSLDGGLDAGIAALVVGDAAFLLDVFVELLTHRIKERKEGCASKTARESSASITGQRRVNLPRPSVDSPGYVADVGETAGPKELRDPHTAPAMVAEGEKRGVARQGGHLFGDLTHRDLPAAGDPADLEFGWFAHVQQDGAFTHELGGGGDIYFERGFHNGGHGCRGVAKSNPIAVGWRVGPVHR